MGPGRTFFQHDLRIEVRAVAVALSNGVKEQRLTLRVERVQFLARRVQCKHLIQRQQRVFCVGICQCQLPALLLVVRIANRHHGVQAVQCSPQNHDNEFFQTSACTSKHRHPKRCEANSGSDSLKKGSASHGVSHPHLRLNSGESSASAMPSA